MTIKETKLQELLHERKAFIGQDSIPWEGWFGDITFIFGLFSFDFSAVGFISANTLKAIAIFIVFFYSAWLLYKTIKCKRYPYSVDDLYEDILNVAERPHSFCLIIIRNTYDSRVNKYLLLYDDRWKCYLFPYCKEGKNEEETQNRIRNYVSSHLGIPGDGIKIEKLFVREHDKYSYSDRVYKHYHHIFYGVDIFQNGAMKANDIIKRRNFVQDGYKYRWFTMAQMNLDKKIAQRNQDVVSDVRSHFGQ